MRDSRRWCVINPTSFLWRHPRAVLPAADPTGPFPRQPLAGSGRAAAESTNRRLGGQWGPAHLLTRCGAFRLHTSVGKHVKCHTRQHVELLIVWCFILKKDWTGLNWFTPSMMTSRQWRSAAVRHVLPVVALICETANRCVQRTFYKYKVKSVNNNKYSVSIRND